MRTGRPYEQMHVQGTSSSTTWMYVLVAAVLFMLLFVNGRKCTGDDEHREYKRNVLGMCTAKKCEDGYESDDDGVCQLLPAASPTAPTGPGSGTQQGTGSLSSTEQTFSLSGGGAPAAAGTSAAAAAAAAAADGDDENPHRIVTKGFMDYVSTDASVSTRRRQQLPRAITGDESKVVAETFACPTFDEAPEAYNVIESGPGCGDECGTCHETYVRMTNTLECPAGVVTTKQRDMPASCDKDCTFEPWQAETYVAGAGTYPAYQRTMAEDEGDGVTRYQRSDTPAEGLCTRECIARTEEVIETDRKGDESDVIEQDTYTSPTDCKQKCEEHTDCKAVDYDGTTCRLLKADKPTVTALSSTYVKLATAEPGTTAFIRGFTNPVGMGKSCVQVDKDDPSRCDEDGCKWEPGALRYTKACNVFECPVECNMATSDQVIGYVWGKGDANGSQKVKCIHGLKTHLLSIDQNVPDSKINHTDIVNTLRVEHNVSFEELHAAHCTEAHWEEPIDGHTYTLFQIEAVNFYPAKYGGGGTPSPSFCPFDLNVTYMRGGSFDTDFRAFHVVRRPALGLLSTITHTYRYKKCEATAWEQKERCSKACDSGELKFERTITGVEQQWSADTVIDPANYQWCDDNGATQRTEVCNTRACHSECSADKYEELNDRWRCTTWDFMYRRDKYNDFIFDD